MIFSYVSKKCSHIYARYGDQQLCMPATKTERLSRSVCSIFRLILIVSVGQVTVTGTTTKTTTKWTELRLGGCLGCLAALAL